MQIITNTRNCDACTDCNTDNRFWQNVMWTEVSSLFYFKTWASASHSGPRNIPPNHNSVDSNLTGNLCNIRSPLSSFCFSAVYFWIMFPKYSQISTAGEIVMCNVKLLTHINNYKEIFHRLSCSSCHCGRFRCFSFPLVCFFLWYKVSQFSLSLSFSALFFLAAACRCFQLSAQHQATDRHN